jgi:hypothetical protein
MFWAGHAAITGEREGLFSVIVDKSVGTIPLRRPRRRWENKTYMGVRGVDMSDLE